MSDYKKFQDTMEYLIKNKPEIIENNIALKGAFKDIASDISDNSVFIDRASDADIVKLMKNEKDYDVLYNKCMRNLKEKALLSEDVSHQIILAYRFLCEDGGKTLNNIIKREHNNQISNNSQKNIVTKGDNSVVFWNESAKARYDAITRYIKSLTEKDNLYTKPCRVKFKNKEYYYLSDGYTDVITSEGLGTLDECEDKYDIMKSIGHLFDKDNKGTRVDINGVLNKAKKNGYKFTPTNKICDYYFETDDWYYTLSSIDKAYSILNDNKTANVICTADDGMLIKNDIGRALVSPYGILCPVEGNVLSIKNGSIKFEKKMLKKTESNDEQQPVINTGNTAKVGQTTSNHSNTPKNNYRQYDSNALVGFRSGVWWKKVIGFLYYALMVLAIIGSFSEDGLWSAFVTYISMSIPVWAFEKSSGEESDINLPMQVLYAIGYSIVYYIVLAIVLAIIDNLF